MADVKVLKIVQHNPDYLMCHFCRNHITVRDELQFFYPEKVGGKLKGVGAFDAVINVQVDKSTEHRRYNHLLVADVFCSRCGEYLGLKLVDILGGTQQHSCGKRMYTLRNGTMMLLLERLFWVDGARTKPGEIVTFPGLP